MGTTSAATTTSGHSLSRDSHANSLSQQRHPLLVAPCQPPPPLAGTTQRNIPITQTTQTAWRWVVGGGCPDAPPQTPQDVYKWGFSNTWPQSLFRGQLLEPPRPSRGSGMTEPPPACHGTARVSLFTGPASVPPTAMLGGVGRRRRRHPYSRAVGAWRRRWFSP